MSLLVASKNPVKVNAAQTAIRSLQGCTQLIASGVSAPSGVAEQPMTEQETRQGAINRVNFLRSLPQTQSLDWCVAIEGGVDNFIDGPATFAYVVIEYNGERSVGRSANLPLPKAFYDQLQQGKELGDVMDAAFGTQNVKQKGGAIGLMTNHLVTRQSAYEMALIMALAKYRFSDIFS